MQGYNQQMIRKHEKKITQHASLFQIPGIKIHAVDLRDWKTTRELVMGLGPVDFLVNNAGDNITCSFLDVTKEDIDRL